MASFKTYFCIQLGNELEVDYGWIGNTICDSKCPSQCEKKTWQFYTEGKNGKGKWKSDPSLEIAGNIFIITA